MALLPTGLAATQQAVADGAERPEVAGRGQDDDRWAITLGSRASGYCPPSDGARRPCETVGPDPDPEDRCYETTQADAAVEACLQHLVDSGELGADVLAEHRCMVAYESLPEDVSEEGYAVAGQTFEQCMVDAASGAGVVGGDDTSADGRPTELVDRGGSPSTPSVPPTD